MRRLRHLSEGGAGFLKEFGNEYPETIEWFMPEYEITFIPLLEKYAQSQGQ